MNIDPNTSQTFELSNEELIEKAVNNNEAVLADNGALTAVTGERTGRSPNDRFIVKEPGTEDLIEWGAVNKPFDSDRFDALWDKVEAYLAEKDRYLTKVHVGAHADHYLPVNVTTETAWHSLFSKLIFIMPEDFNQSAKKEWEIMSAANYECIPSEDGTNSEGCVIINFARRKVLLAGMKYAGEMKKSMFSIQNFLMPEKDVLPMHCSANVNANGKVALFFGLSGTGKTTLSADPSCSLIGDDEHGWSKDSVFNFEGGCYAKMIRLSKDAEPEIYETTKKTGTILENVVLNEETGELDLDDDTLAENTRGAYPLSFIPNSSETGRGPIPKNIILLTCDAFGVLPPIARLSASQTMYHFLSGYTAKVAGTEKGVTEPEATFSACFGAPFMPRHPSEYGNLLKDLIHKYDVNCWLVNTGWSGGPVGEGERMPIKATRALLSAALDGTLNKAEMRVDKFFGFEVPLSVDGIDQTILVPRNTWSNKENYDAQATKLVEMFSNNFSIFEEHVNDDVINAAPRINIT